MTSKTVIIVLMQAVTRKFPKNKNIPAEFIGMVFSIPLLPAERFPEAFQIIQRKSIQLEINNFYTYLRRQWLSKADVVTVDNMRLRTTGIIENGNRYLQARFGKHPNLWNFLCMYNKCMLVKIVDLEYIVGCKLHIHCDIVFSVKLDDLLQDEEVKVNRIDNNLLDINLPQAQLRRNEYILLKQKEIRDGV